MPFALVGFVCTSMVQMGGVWAVVTDVTIIYEYQKNVLVQLFFGLLWRSPCDYAVVCHVFSQPRKNEIKARCAGSQFFGGRVEIWNLLFTSGGHWVKHGWLSLWEGSNVSDILEVFRLQWQRLPRAIKV